MFVNIHQNNFNKYVYEGHHTLQVPLDWEAGLDTISYQLTLLPDSGCLPGVVDTGHYIYLYIVRFIKTLGHRRLRYSQFGPQ